MSNSRGAGSVRRRGRESFQIRYFNRHGKRIEETVRVSSMQKAQKILRERQGAVDRGTHVERNKITVAQLLDNLEADYRAKGRSAGQLRYQIARLRKALGAERAQELGEREIIEYRDQQLAAGLAPATINRDLAALHRSFVLASKARIVERVPDVDRLPEDNVRQGFFGEEDFHDVLKHLPEDIAAVIRFLYLTGWRRGEVIGQVCPTCTRENRPTCRRCGGEGRLLGLQWRQVDFTAETIRLEPGSTKNKDGRTFPFGEIPELRDLLLRQRARTDEMERERSMVIPWVFHRGGKPIKDFREVWQRATAKAGCPGALVHDFRRSVVRRYERHGVSRSVAMKLTGHRTESVYRRYAIVAEEDLKDGLRRVYGRGAGAGSEEAGGA